jgi:response regulator RpfG family c-di-GMP phosphodiesterase
MTANPQIERCGVLYVDDEKTSLKYFTRVFQDDFTVLTAENARTAYRLLLQHKQEIGILLADQRLPGEQGLDFLSKAKEIHPAAIRILTTTYSDQNVIDYALNSASISTVVTKPWNVAELETVLRGACKLYEEQRTHAAPKADVPPGDVHEAQKEPTPLHDH